MINKTNFFITFLLGVVVVCPAIAATTPASQEWTKNNFSLKSTSDNRYNNLVAAGVRQGRDLLFENKKPSAQKPDYSAVANPLRTTAQNAFGGINELLTKVDGNDGTENSAVELKTTAKNAFGAINELKEDVDTVYDNGTQKRVNVKIVNDFTSNDFNAIKAAAENND